MAVTATAIEGEPRLRIMVLGLRGIIDVQGGIETHARRLYPLLARLGCDVEIVQRGAYYPRDRRPREWRRVALTYLWSPRTRIVETAVHTLLGVLYAAIKRPDVLHLHAVGPGLLAPLARLFGLRVVVTHHGADYEREKWGPFAKAVLRTGERLGIGFAHRPIVVSPVLKQTVETRYHIGATLIPNGAPLATPRATYGTLRRFGLERGRYVLCVARLDPGKRQHDLIAAFQQARPEGWKLVLVGAIESGDAYSDQLVAAAARDPTVVLTGYQSGVALHELYSHAGLFVLPSAGEGHPIALLEAAVYEVPLLASAIPANLALPLPRDQYFPVGDTQALARKLQTMTNGRAASSGERRALHATIRADYSWRKAAELTSSVYRCVARGGWQHG
ncbi:MAG TPA: glycosyltransferase family 4 protein [Gammaproteobacteria bacterium]|nr:glycosyltransferase family 4 protein [Gammaproteobacteria bacterium]